MMAYFIYQLDWAKRSPESLFLWVCEVFLEEISLWFNRLTKEIHASQWGQALSSPLGAWMEQTGKGKENPLFLRCDIYLSLPLSFGAPGSLVFGLRLESQQWFSWFSCFQTQTELNYCFPRSPFWRRQIGETSEPPWLHEPIPILRPNPYNVCNISICYKEP